MPSPARPRRRPRARTAVVVAAVVVVVLAAGAAIAQGGGAKQASPHGTISLEVGTPAPVIKASSPVSIALHPSWGAVRRVTIRLMLAQRRAIRTADAQVAVRVVVPPTSGSELVQLEWRAPRTVGVRYLYACVAPRPRNGVLSTCSVLRAVSVVAASSTGGVTGASGGNPAGGPAAVAAPVLSSSLPASPNAALRPTFNGTAPADQTVTLYASGNCSGASAGSATSTDTGGLSITPDQDVAFGTTSAWSAAVTGAGASPCSASISYRHLGVIVNATAADMFSPQVVSIAAGTMVRWHGQGGGPHTITPSGTPAFTPDAALSDGDHYDIVFTQPGDYAYYCQNHPPDMTGEIDVS